jgi:hypothetical protein
MKYYMFFDHYNYNVKLHTIANESKEGLIIWSKEISDFLDKPKHSNPMLQPG